MTAELTWSKLHDATLETVELRWATGEVVLHVRTGEQGSSHVRLVASSVQRLVCSRLMPWGFSVSINQVRGPVLLPDSNAQSIEIEMQAGDVIRVDAIEFCIVPYRQE